MAEEKSLEGYSPDEITAMATVYSQLSTNPQTRELILRAQKALNPKANIPEIDIADRIRAGDASTQKELGEMRQKLLERDARDQIRDERDTLAKAGYTADEITAVEKLMIDEKIPSYATAAKFYRASTTIAAPTNTYTELTATNSLPTDALGAMKKPGGVKQWARNQASEAINDLRAGRIKLQ